MGFGCGLLRAGAQSTIIDGRIPKSQSTMDRQLLQQFQAASSSVE
jgi:hypothetical protein